MRFRQPLFLALAGLLLLGAGCGAGETGQGPQDSSAADQSVNQADQIPQPGSRHPDLPPMPGPFGDDDMKPTGSGDPNDSKCTAKSSGAAMTLGEAKEIGRQNSDCAGLLGEFEGGGMCNYQTETWWVTIKPAAGKEKAGCNPACVINVSTGEAEVNWRCTGLLPPA